jgi:hypothetical protein
MGPKSGLPSGAVPSVAREPLVEPQSPPADGPNGLGGARELRCREDSRDRLA